MDTRLRRDIAWNLVPVALLAIVGLGLNFLVGGWWGAAALGSFTLVTIPFFSFAVLGACGIQYAVLRAIAERPDEPDRVAVVVVGALIPTVLLAAAVTVAFVLLREPIGVLLESDAVAEGMWWAAPGVFCFSINKVMMGVVNGLRRMRAFAIYTSLRYTLIGVGLVLARVYQIDGNTLPVIWTFTEGVLLLVLLCELFATVRVVHGASKPFEGERWAAWARRHLDFGVRGVLATLSTEINSKIDVWLLGVVMPDDRVGIYALASALYEGVIQIAIVLQNNLNPIIARGLGSAAGQGGLGAHAEITALARRTRKWFVPAMVAACALGAATYPFLIPWLIGDPTFADGAASFGIMMAALALASPWLPFNQILLMANKPGWYTVYVVIILAVNAAGSLALVPHLGLEGAALGVGMSMIVSGVLVPITARRLTGVRV